jgi:hypothetical protein
MAKASRKAAPKAAAKARGKKGEAKKAFPLVGRNDLNRLLEQAAILKNRAASANGSRSELIGTYVTKKHLHAGAFRSISRLWKLGQDDPQKLWLELAHFDDMREKAGLDRMAKEQGQLLPAIEDGEESKPEKAEKVVSYPREVEERAGDAA